MTAAVASRTQHIYHCSKCHRYTWASDPTRTVCGRCIIRKPQPWPSNRTAELIEEVEWQMSFNFTPETVARYLGYDRVEALLRRLSRAGRDDLAEALHRDGHDARWNWGRD